jgi:hypothetical protein
MSETAEEKHSFVKGHISVETPNEEYQKYLPLSTEDEAKVKQRLWDVLTDKQKVIINGYDGGVVNENVPRLIDVIKWEVKLTLGTEFNPDYKGMAIS